MTSQLDSTGTAAVGEDTCRAWVNATTWRGLTNDERMEIYSESLTIWSCMEAVEAKLKEKNTRNGGCL